MKTILLISACLLPLMASQSPSIQPDEIYDTNNPLLPIPTLAPTESDEEDFMGDEGDEEVESIDVYVQTWQQEVPEPTRLSPVSSAFPPPEVPVNTPNHDAHPEFPVRRIEHDSWEDLAVYLNNFVANSNGLIVCEEGMRIFIETLKSIERYNLQLHKNNYLLAREKIFLEQMRYINSSYFEGEEHRPALAIWRQNMDLMTGKSAVSLARWPYIYQFLKKRYDKIGSIRRQPIVSRRMGDPVRPASYVPTQPKAETQTSKSQTTVFNCCLKGQNA